MIRPSSTLMSSGIDGAVQAAGVVVPEVLAEAGEGLAHAAGGAGLNAVDHLTVEAVHAVDGGCGGLGGGPAVHIGFALWPQTSSE